MNTPTRQSHRKASRRGEVRARLMFAATKAQARAICKAAPFLRMTEGEQLEIAGEALYSDANWSSTWAETTAQVCQGYKLQARAVLAAMGMGGAK